MKIYCLVVEQTSDTWAEQREAFPYKKHRTYGFISKQIQQRIAATPAVMETVHPRLDLEQSSTILKNGLKARRCRTEVDVELGIILASS